MSAPGPGNLFVAKGVLKAIGLEEGRDYTMQEQPMPQHIPGIQSGQFEVAYSLEPVVSMMVHRGVGRKLEAGVIATHMLGRPDACAVLAGGVMSDRFLQGAAPGRRAARAGVGEGAEGRQRGSEGARPAARRT